MGNVGSNSGDNSRRRNGSHGSHPLPSSPVQSQPEITGNRYVFTAATPYPQYPSPNLHQFYQYPAYYPSQDSTISVPFPYHPGGGSHSDLPLPNLVGGRHPCGLVSPPIVPYVEHQKAVTIRNEVNLKKETLRIEPDEENPGQFLVSFILDATVPGSITIIFFAKEGANCSLTPAKKNLISPVTVSFQQGLGQKFRQPSGTGINFSMFEETELMKNGDMEVYPLSVKAEASALDSNGSETTNAMLETINSQITQAVFDKEKGEYKVRVVKQILWVNGMRYELQEIYGIGNSVDRDFDGNDPGKECVICLSEPQDTTILPCRHMCLCSGCAKVLRFQTNRCPICRQPVERLLEIKVNNKTDD